MEHISLAGGEGGDIARLRKPPNEKLRAWTYCVALVGIFAAATVGIAVVSVIAVLNLGTPAGLVIMFVLFCMALGTVIWLGNGKQRP
jgi:hypothetical protein